MNSSTTRAECVKMLEKLVGTRGIPSFLTTPQEGLGGLTGGQILQHHPERLLEALRGKQEAFRAKSNDLDALIAELRSIQGQPA